MSLDLNTKTSREISQQVVKHFQKESLLLEIPAIVEGIDEYENDQVIDVRTVFDVEYPNGTILKAPPLKGIFVRLPSAGGFSIKFPVRVGDKVTLKYSHKDLGSFLDSKADGQVVIRSDALPDIKDCYAELGMGTYTDHQNPSKDNFIIEGEKTKITLTPEGKAELEVVDFSMIVENEYYVKAATYKVEVNEAEFTADIKSGGTVTATTDCVAGSTSVSLVNHTHGYIDSKGTAATPTPSTTTAAGIPA